MAQAADQHTTREWSLTDYLRYVRITLGCGINVALCEMERRIVSGQLLLIPNGDAVEINRFDFLSNYTLQLDSDDRVKVVTLRPAAVALTPGGITYITKFDESDPKSPIVRRGPGRVLDGYYTVTERPPPDEQSKGKADGPQVRRVKEVLREFIFPPDGCAPVDMPVKTVRIDVNEIFAAWGWKLASHDSVARAIRAMGRRRC